MAYAFPQWYGSVDNLSDFMPGASLEATDLLAGLLQVD
eukprot:CAMPEP_0185590284 /NCGR_PEP_ID=MMETSP0434-20130131/60250_1 /TAXON_ID=626734 ORGANISM="Favella taraikaensis, Strain Fe Narragansett Bay" /NCGR_SAMPLE_ID=MMETSP0434 /ASSEMBLY_ACC=CAM_ASM_000379 /LENGTH=37 /DNA_ID= /DNA_START= /DNA_END= /DNA_ORIENTATION=